MKSVFDIYKECPHCGEGQSFNVQNFISGKQSYDRQMGKEVVYDIEGHFVCRKCSWDGTLRGTIAEYPENTQSYEDISLN